MSQQDILTDLMHRIKTCWDMVEIFTKNKDPHGIYDMGVEI